MQRHHGIHVIGAVLLGLFFAAFGLGILGAFNKDSALFSHLSQLCLAAFALIFSGLVLFAAIYGFISNLRFRKLAWEADGEVVGRKMAAGSPGTTDYSPVIRFTTESGKKMTFISDFSANIGIPKPGSKVKVLYDPEHPHHAKWNNFFFLWIFPWLLSAFALLVALHFLGSVA
jgi:hypothetical protein